MYSQIIHMPTFKLCTTLVSCELFFFNSFTFFAETKIFSESLGASVTHVQKVSLLL